MEVDSLEVPNRSNLRGSRSEENINAFVCRYQYLARSLKQEQLSGHLAK